MSEGRSLSAGKERRGGNGMSNGAELYLAFINISGC